jgi:hypothetical protein
MAKDGRILPIALPVDSDSKQSTTASRCTQSSKPLGSSNHESFRYGKYEKDANVENACFGKFAVCTLVSLTGICFFSGPALVPSAAIDSDQKLVRYDER